MRGRISLARVLLLTLATTTTAVAILGSNLVSGFDIVGYLPEYRTRTLDIEYTFSIATDIVLFSIDPDQVFLGPVNAKQNQHIEDGPQKQFYVPGRFPPPIEAFEKMQKAAKKHGTRLLLGIGGAGRSSRFRSALSDPTVRSEFVEILATKVIPVYGLDGVEINWQFPHSPGDYNLLKELLKELRPHCKRLTISYRPLMPENQAELIKDAGIPAYVDRITVMAYDLQGDHAGHHSSFNDAMESLREAEKAGLPKEKILLGIPFYGRNVLSAEVAITYEDMVLRSAALPEHESIVRPNSDVAKLPGNSASAALNYMYNSYETVRRKAEYVRNGLFGGVAIWELGQDCRMHPVSHAFEGGVVHEATCRDRIFPSLLSALTEFTTKKEEL